MRLEKFLFVLDFAHLGFSSFVRSSSRQNQVTSKHGSCELPTVSDYLWSPSKLFLLQLYLFESGLALHNGFVGDRLGALVLALGFVVASYVAA